jgi:hypothetical protein
MECSLHNEAEGEIKMESDNIFDALCIRLDDIEEECHDGADYKFNLLRSRKELQSIKKELIEEEDESTKYEKSFSLVQDKIAAIESEMECIADNSVEENVNIILKNAGTMKHIFATYDISDIFMKEEIVFIVNNVLTRNNILDINWGNLIYLYSVAWGLSAKFDTDKVDAILDKLYANIKLQTSKIYQQEDIYIERTIEYIDSNLCYIKSLNYLPDSFKTVVNERLEALKLLYILN